MISRIRTLLVAAGVLVTFVPTIAAAQTTYPDRPISIIVPYAPGGTTDVMGRALAESLSRQLKQPVIIENKPGAGGTLGVLDMMNAKPDGYRLTMAPVSIFRQPHLQETRYDPIRDLTYIASFLSYDFAVTVRADSPFDTIQDLVAYARKNPGEISYGTPGRFTGNHVVLAALGKHEGVTFTHIPYKGDSGAMAALLGGHTQVAVVTNSVLPHLRSGAVRVLATADRQRNTAFEGVPTLVESSYDVVVPSPLGIAGPAGLPQSIVQTLDQAIRAALADPQVQRAFENFGVRGNYMDNQTYAVFAKTAFAEERDIVRNLGMED